jgi:hypothetical protein
LPCLKESTSSLEIVIESLEGFGFSHRWTHIYLALPYFLTVSLCWMEMYQEARVTEGILAVTGTGS